MKFSYLQIPGFSKRPLVPVSFRFGSHHLSQPVLCLVDSGTDLTYLDMGVGEELGINFAKIKPLTSFSINGRGFIGYPAKLVAEIGGWEFFLEAIFSRSVRRTFCVLGQEGLFDMAHISFERFSWEVEINPRKEIN